MSCWDMLSVRPKSLDLLNLAFLHWLLLLVNLICVLLFSCSDICKRRCSGGFLAFCVFPFPLRLYEYGLYDIEIQYVVVTRDSWITFLLQTFRTL